MQWSPEDVARQALDRMEKAGLMTHTALLSLLLLGVPETGVLTLRLTDLRNAKGQVGCALYWSEQGFPKDPKAAAQTKWCAISNGEAVCTFDATAPSTYAAVCFHDENGNRVLDTTVFSIPTEGMVTTNHATGFMGPPSFADAKFWLRGGETEIRLRMGY